MIVHSLSPRVFQRIPSGGSCSTRRNTGGSCTTPCRNHRSAPGPWSRHGIRSFYLSLPPLSVFSYVRGPVLVPVLDADLRDPSSSTASTRGPALGFITRFLFRLREPELRKSKRKGLFPLDRGECSRLNGWRSFAPSHHARRKRSSSLRPRDRDEFFLFSQFVDFQHALSLIGKGRGGSKPGSR